MIHITECTGRNLVLVLTQQPTNHALFCRKKENKFIKIMQELTIQTSGNTSIKSEIEKSPRKAPFYNDYRNQH